MHTISHHSIPTTPKYPPAYIPLKTPLYADLLYENVLTSMIFDLVCQFLTTLTFL